MALTTTKIATTGIATAHQTRRAAAMPAHAPPAASPVASTTTCRHTAESTPQQPVRQAPQPVQIPRQQPPPYHPAAVAIATVVLGVPTPVDVGILVPAALIGATVERLWGPCGAKRVFPRVKVGYMGSTHGCCLSLQFNTAAITVLAV